MGSIATVKALSESGSWEYMDFVEGSGVKSETGGTGARGDRARTEVDLWPRANRALLLFTSQETPINRPCPKANKVSQRAPLQYVGIVRERYECTRK